MNVSEYLQHLEKEITQAARAALKDTASTAEDLIQKNIPPSRKKTRRAVTHHIRKRNSGYRATIGLDFARKYRARGTKTARLFRRAWKQSKPAVVTTLQRRLNHHLKRI